MASKKEKKTWPLLVGAIGFGVVAALLGGLYLKSREAAILASLKGPEVPNITVVVAKRDLRKGQTISPELFATRSIPQNFVHEDAIFPGEFSRYAGQALVTDLGAGKSLLKSFIDADFPVDFSDIVPAGKRAMTVTVDEVNSIGGHLRPGNYIDLYVNIPFNVSGFSPKFITAGLVKELPPDLKGTIPQELLQKAIGSEIAEEIISLATPSDVILPVVQNVRVLATGSDPYEETLDRLRQPQRRREGHFSSVTLEVTPEQSAYITLALDKGEILALLRNRKDHSASQFTTITPGDLFSNASNMAAAEKARASRATLAGGVDASGNLVDANGQKIMSREELAAAGFTVNENGQIIDKDGNVVDPKDIVVGPDGKVMTKQQLAAAGLTVNESGQIVDKDGNVVSADDLVVAADGSVMTKQQLAAAGLSVNENGEIVDSKGKVVSPDDIIVSKDGKVMTKEQLAAAGLTSASGVDSSGNLVGADGKVLASKEQLEAAGYTINENGEIVDKNGNVVDPSNLVVDKNGNVGTTDGVMVAADGSVLTKEQLAAAGLTVNEKGQIVDKNGNVVDPKDVVVASDGSIINKAELAAAGLSINEDGQIVDANGNVVSSDDLIKTADGRLMSKQQLAAAGLKVNEKGEIVDASGRVLSAEEIAKVAENVPIAGSGGAPGSYDLIIGGSSKDGVPKSQSVQVQE